MINIRNGVFETNSSSSHSICINNNQPDIAVDLARFIDNNGVWSLKNDELTFYRHPFRVLTTPESKIKYAIACVSYSGPQSHEFNMIEKVVSELEPKFQRFEFESEQWDGSEIYCLGGTDDSILFPWLEHNNVDLKTFISDSRYFIICDGDEYNIFDSFMRAGLIDKNVQCKGDFTNEYGCDNIYNDDAE